MKEKFFIPREKGRPEKKPKHLNIMKTLNDILAELKALDTTVLESVVAGLAVAQTDLEAVIAAPAVTPAVPVVTVDGVTFVPEVKA